MRWLLIGLLISVGALLLLAGAVTRHIVRQRRMQSDEAAGKAGDRGPGPDLLENAGLEEPPAGDHDGGNKGDR